jgi:tetratricopeptide (TPR) repeat protein
VEISLASGRRRGFIFLVSVVVFAVLFFQAVRLSLAARHIRSSNFEEMKSAVGLEPGDAEYWDRLGRFRLLDFEQADFPEAIRYFQRAVAISSRTARYWVDLSAAYEASGDLGRARHALESAREVYPASAEVQWSFGNFLLRQGEHSEGFEQIRRAIVIDPKLLPQGIRRGWRATQDVNQLLDQMLPPDPNAYLQTLDFFASIQAADPALVVWKRLLTLGRPFPISRAFPALDELIREDRAADARHVWRDALAEAGLPGREPVDHSVVWDGSFDQDFQNGGFGWRADPISGISADFDTNTFHSPPRSLRMDFGGVANLDLWEPFQCVPVEPDRTYHFRAYLRTAAISTESGIRFYVFDPHHSGAVELLTSGLNGTHEWTLQEADLTTGPATHILRIVLRRLPSRLFDNRLSGSAWVDDVSLIPAGEPSGAEPP